jgi:hypothetical protein
VGTAGAVGKGAGGVGGANTETAGQINNDNAVSPFTTMYTRQPHQHPYRHLPAQFKPPSSNSFQTPPRSTPLLLPTRGALHSYPPIDRSSHCRTVFTARRPNDHPPICELRDCVFFGLRRLCYSYAVSLEHKPLCIHATL